MLLEFRSEFEQQFLLLALLDLLEQFSINQFRKSVKLTQWVLLYRLLEFLAVALGVILSIAVVAAGISASPDDLNIHAFVGLSSITRFVSSSYHPRRKSFILICRGFVRRDAKGSIIDQVCGLLLH